MPNDHASHPPLSSYAVAARLRGTQGSQIRDLLRYAKQPGMLSLAGGLPAPDLFDVEGLRAAAAAALGDSPVDALQYGMTDGQPALKRELVRLMGERGVAVDADRIVVTTGSQQGIDLLARTLLDPGDTVIVERPAYLAALQAFALAEAHVATIDGDSHGARVEQLEDLLPRLLEEGRRVKLIYLVANFANPSGATLSRARRERLARIAARHRIVAIEDDPYGELRSFGSPVPPLLAIATDVAGADDWCGYLSTFSKILAPGLRVGWLVLPPALAQQVALCKQALDLHTSSLSQEIAARYLESGRLASRMPAIRAAYRERNEALAAALERHLRGRIDFNRPDGGMFLWARLRDGIDSGAVLPDAIEQGMIFIPGSAFYASDPDVATLRLSFATATPGELDVAVQRLSRALEQSVARLRPSS
ncbi:MAG TPA: PLP-dependent aminotransferase family protein [Burkholderiaceae bacterium]|nr:PLP-dependent aminotransferase family protein [Burkholderiaceae bacterium]